MNEAMTDISPTQKDKLKNAEVGDEIFVDENSPLEVQNNSESGVVASRNGYDYVVTVDGREVTVELMDTGRVEESREIETTCVSVLHN